MKLLDELDEPKADWRKGPRPYRIKYQTIADAVKDKSERVESGCIEWRATLDEHGYAQLWWRGTMRRAHRIYYQEVHGVRLDRWTFLDHLCRNPKCVNPEHLEPVTPRENALRGISFSAENAKKTCCPKGHPYDKICRGGGRACRACLRAYAIARYHRKKVLKRKPKATQPSEKLRRS